MADLRDALRLTQPEFGALINRKSARIQQYESGAKIPDDVLERMAALAFNAGQDHLRQRVDVEIRRRRGEAAEPPMSSDAAIFAALEEIRAMSGKLDRIAKAVGAQPQPRSHRGKG